MGNRGELTMDLAAIAELMGQFPPVKRKALHCHPAVAAALWALTPPAERWFPFGHAMGLTGIDVIEEADMEPGAWELREDGSVIESGRLRPWSPGEVSNHGEPS
jgi:hypothetical protein